MLANYYLDADGHEVYSNIYDFSVQRVYPTAQERDLNHRWDRDLWKELSSIGLAGLLIPEKYGGQGSSCLNSAYAFEALASGSGDIGIGISLGAHSVIGNLPIVLFGSEKQKQKYLPKLASGEFISGWGLTEPNSGSDAASLRTRAVMEEDSFLVDGSKMFITNGPIGDIFTVLARTKKGSERSPVGISALIVEKGFKGFSAGKPLIKLGICTSQTSEIVFENMRVPKENLLGPLHSGFTRVGHSILEWERILLPAITVGAIDFVLDRSIRYSRERKQFGRSIIEYPAIQKKIAMMWVCLQAMRRTTYSLARSKDRGINVLAGSSLTKILITEMGESIFREAIQVFGGYGFIKEYDVERPYRDSKLGSIGAGSSEVMRMIASSLVKDHSQLKLCFDSLEISNDSAEAKRLYGEEITSEVRLLYSLKDFLESVVSKPTERKEQNLAFAYAELLTVYMSLVHSFADCSQSSREYSVRDKKRDYLLFTSYLMDHYIDSIRTLYSLDRENGARVMEFYIALGDLTHQASDCLRFLTETVAVAHKGVSAFG